MALKTTERKFTVPNDGHWHELPGELWEVKSPISREILLEVIERPGEKRKARVFNKGLFSADIVYTIVIKEKTDG